MSRGKLTPERAALVARYVAAGEPHRVAAERADLGERTLERYLQRGREADESARAALAQLPEHQRLDVEGLSDEPVAPPDPRDADAYPDGSLATDSDTSPPMLRWTDLGIARGDADPPFTRALLYLLPESEWPYWRLWRSLKMADAASEAVLLARLQESGRGYTARQTTTTTVTKRVKDESTGELKAVEERTTVVEVEKDVRHPWLNVWLLQARFPERYGRYKVTGDGQVEDTGSDDGEVGSMDDEKAAAFAGLDELEVKRQARDDEAEAVG